MSRLGRQLGPPGTRRSAMWPATTRHSDAESSRSRPTVHGIACLAAQSSYLLCGTSTCEIGMPISLDRKSAWIIGGALLMLEASTLAGCASMPLANSSSAEKATTSQEIDGSINPSRKTGVDRTRMSDRVSVSTGQFEFNGQRHHAMPARNITQCQL